MLGGTGLDYTNALVMTSSNGYIAVGQSDSSDGDVETNQGEFDIWIIELDPSGGLLWERSYGGSGAEFGSFVIDAGGNGFVLGGNSNSDDGDVGSNNGDRDAWVLRVDDGGNLLWETALGGSATDRALVAHQKEDDGFLILGHSNSNDGDLNGNNGSYDFWIMEWASDPLSIDQADNPSFNLFPNPAYDEVIIEVPSNLRGTLMRVSDITGVLL